MVEYRDLFPLVKVLQVPAGHAPLLWTALALLDASLRRKVIGIPPDHGIGMNSCVSVESYSTSSSRSYSLQKQLDVSRVPYLVF